MDFGKGIGGRRVLADTCGLAGAVASPGLDYAEGWHPRRLHRRGSRKPKSGSDVTNVVSGL
jgi:hypothetical protein